MSSMSPAGAVSPAPPPSSDGAAKEDEGKKKPASPPPAEKEEEPEEHEEEEPQARDRPEEKQPPAAKKEPAERRNSLLDAAAGLATLHEDSNGGSLADHPPEGFPLGGGGYRDWKASYIPHAPLSHSLLYPPLTPAERELALRSAALDSLPPSRYGGGLMGGGLGSSSSLLYGGGGAYDHPLLSRSSYDPAYDPLYARAYDPLLLGGRTPYDPPPPGAGVSPVADRAAADAEYRSGRPPAAPAGAWDPSTHPPLVHSTGRSAAQPSANAALPTPHQLRPHNEAKRTFAKTLYAVVSDPSLDHIIKWLPHGKGFVIHDRPLFEEVVLPRYFDGAKYTSFTRRLKRWKFSRIPSGPEMGAYYSKHFVRDGQKEWASKMKYDPREDEKGGKKAGEEEEGENEKEGMEKEGAADQSSAEEGKEEEDEEAEERTLAKDEKEAKAERVRARIQKKVERKVQEMHLQKEKGAEEEEAVRKGLEAKEGEEETTTGNEKKSGANKEEPESAAGKKRKSISPETPSTSHRHERNELPLPSALPKRDAKRAKPTTPGGHRRKMHDGPSALRRAHCHPGRDPRERRLAELEAELALVRSRRAGGPPEGGGAGGPMPPPRPYASLDASRRILEVERAKRVLEAERVLEEERLLGLRAAARGGGLDAASHWLGYGGYGAGGRLGPSLAGPLGAPSLPLSGMSSLRSYEAALGAPSSAMSSREERPVMMSKKEEEEFAEFLFAKRQGLQQARRFGASEDV